MGMIQDTKVRYKLLVALSFVILMIVLFFGLRGIGFYFSNDVAWLKYEAGLRFEKYGVAYTFVDDDQIKDTISSTESFSIEIAAKPRDIDLEGFNIMLSLHDGEDHSQLIVGQWESYIIVMNDNDYSNSRKIKRISAEVFSEPPEKLLVTITTGDEGTKLYVDGKLVEARSDLVLNIPKKNTLKIILGNSVYGKHSWRGEVYGLAFYADRLGPEIIENRFNAWSKNHIFPYAKDEKPFLFFSFNEREGTEVKDYITGIQKLNIPVRYHILKKHFISPPWKDFKANKSFFNDFINNLLGFIPLGFILCALFIQSGGIFRKKAILFSVVSCFLVSLGIEVTQAWIPSRSSQVLDLMLNTIGAFIGTIVCKYISGRPVEVFKT